MITDMLHCDVLVMSEQEFQEYWQQKQQLKIILKQLLLDEKNEIGRNNYFSKDSDVI